MDSERFDGLVRSFGQTRSRRQTLRGLAGVAAGVVALGAGAASAGKPTCKPLGRKCTDNDTCCGAPEVWCPRDLREESWPHLSDMSRPGGQL